MNILIKGIDMPEDGGTIVLKIKGSKIYREYPRHKFQPTRIKDAEAIQIPTPHGDLIDRNTVRDECYKTMEELMQSTTINISAEALSLLCGFTIINNAPTILEAEG